MLQMFSTELPAESFFTVAHCADQTHAGDCKAEQGYTCMDIVDTDRCVEIQGHSMLCTMYGERVNMRPLWVLVSLTL